MGFLKDRYNEYGKGMQVTLSTFVQTVKPRKMGGGAATVQSPWHDPHYQEVPDRVLHRCGTGPERHRHHGNA